MVNLADVVTGLGADAVPAAGGGWIVRVPTERRGSLSVAVSESERTVALRVFVLRGPDQGHREVYRRLLEKNLDIRHWRFGLDADGDIVAAADVLRDVLDVDLLDGLLGALSAAVDEIAAGIIQAGFAE